MRIDPRLLLALTTILPGACAAPRPAAESADAASSGATTEGSALGLDGSTARGAELFARHCALCHGRQGRGDGPAAPLLSPSPRDFGGARFRIVSTVSGTPSDADLEAVLLRGVPGSAMPSYSWMSSADLDALVGEVRALAIDALAADLVASGEGASDDDLRALARERLAPGPPIPELARPRRTDELLVRGRLLFEKSCASCHGDDGRGAPADPRPNEDGSLNWARDFTAGYLKGGASREALHARVRCGMPGSAMPATSYDDEEDYAALVAYVQELVPAGSAERLVQRSLVVRVNRTDGPVPTAPDDPRWSAGLAVEALATPLFWSDDAVRHPEITALHDGEEISFRVRWEDETRDDGALGSSLRVDAVALQLALGPQPALVGMGAPGHPSNLWHWVAGEPLEDLGHLDLVDPVHRHGEGPWLADAPLYVPVPRGEGTSRGAQGVGVGSAELTGAVAVASASRWEDGWWEVVLTRSLAARTAFEVPLEPAARAHLALAVWDGSAGEHGGRKSITTWHTLELAP